MEKFDALKADNEEIQARLTAFESRSSPQSMHQASVEPPDALIAQQATETPQSEDKRWRPEEVGSFDGTAMCLP